jgi:opacity protein-like surface antigen
MNREVGEYSMKTARTANGLFGYGLLLVLIHAALVPLTTHAESYVAGQFGVTLPQSLSNGKVTQDGFGGLDLSDQPLKSSAMVGGKLGHYFSKARWLGIETGLSYTTPNIKAGSLTFSGPGGPPQTISGLAGVSQRIVTWDTDMIFRYPGYRLQPYIGIGPSILFATLKGPTAPPGQSSTAIGFNAEGGVQYYLTRQWTLFGEGKYTRAQMNYSSNHSDPNADPFGFRATYSAFTLSVGIGYHF